MLRTILRLLRPTTPRGRRVGFCSLASLIAGCMLVTTAAAQSGVTLGVSARIDAEVHGPLPEPDLRGSLGRVEARSPDGDVITTLRLRVADDRMLVQGVLPDLAGAQMLVPITSEALWPCSVHASDPAARFLPASLVAVGLGGLRLGSGPPEPQPQPGDVLLVLVYADTNVNVQATCVEGLDTPLHVDTDLRPGWNLLASELLRDAAVDHVLLRTATTEEITRARWFSTMSPEPVAPDRHRKVPGDDD